EGLAEVLARHRRAFQMPSGPATAPGGVPAGAGRIGVLGRLPQREIAGVALIGGLVLLDRGQLVQALVGEPAVLWPGAHVEIHVARIAGVGMPAGDESLDQVDHLRDMTGGAGLVGGREHAECVVCSGELPLETVRPGPPGHVRLGGLGQDLVVDIGDVAHQGDLEATAPQPPHQDVEGDRATQVADVWGPLHGSATQVDAHVPSGTGHEVADFTGGGIMQANVHAGEFTGDGQLSGPAPVGLSLRNGRAAPKRPVVCAPPTAPAGAGLQPALRWNTCSGRIRTITRSLSVPSSPSNGLPVYLRLSAWIRSPSGSSATAASPRTSRYSWGWSAG